MVTVGRDQKSEHFSRAGVRRNDEANFDDESRPGETLFPTFGSEGYSPAIPYNPSTVASSPGSIDSLPPPAVSDKIIKFTLDELGYRLAVVHPPTFFSECAEFESWGDKRGTQVNPAWLSLYYAILCTGVKHMSPLDAMECGLSPGMYHCPPFSFSLRSN